MDSSFPHSSQASGAPDGRGHRGGWRGQEEGEVEGTIPQCLCSLIHYGQTSSITGTDSGQPDKDKCHGAGVNREESICQ